MCWIPEHVGGRVPSIRTERTPELEKDAKLRIAGQPGESATQLLAKLMHTLLL